MLGETMSSGKNFITKANVIASYLKARMRFNDKYIGMMED
jgi:hypothetical protein